ncbi:hypothetical protein [Hymenobacter actinosclerus]|uniref:PH domain-containing protein n=1 Tax=Hymenobacter actinosclerus TaxID=82805 RepID=A0A1I0IAF5_9BACT|nr:hypothetical protein [Hymenobacter actinosclerus]SET93603.1 hypothetical protein SAMN04487998_3243 [Hymenobacter actinosclerus]
MKLLAFLRPLLEAAALVAAVMLGLRLVTGLFSRKSYVYRLNYGRQLRLLFWPLLCLGVGLPFLGAFFYADALAPHEWALLLVMAAVVLGFAGPALLLHLQYAARNLHTTLVFEPKQNQLEVYEGATPIPFEKRDLLRVERVTCRSRRPFWSAYDYLRLHLRDGQVITLTSVLTDLQPLTEFLRSTPLERRQVWICWL